ncbi:MAG: MEMAR_RS02690 family S-layer glycoprotein, partial [Methanomicrobiales archaeon]
PLWADDSGNPARIKIEVTTPGGGKTYEMGGVTLTNMNLNDAKVYYGTVDPAGEAAGEYSAVAKWQYPTGFSDWASNSNTATFSIITKPVTITANKDSVIRSNPFVVTISGQSDTDYYVYIKTASLTANQYPKLQPDQPGVNRSAAAMTQIAASAIGNEVSGYQDTEAIVTTKADGTRPIQFNTTDNTKDREFTVKVAKVGDETQKYDTVKVKIEKGSVTVAYEGTGSYYLGEEITLTGTNSDSDTTYLFMTGPNLAANGVRLDDIDTAATSYLPGTFNTVTVESDDTWEFKWDTSAINGGTIDSGTYTIYAVSEDLNKADLSGAQYQTASVIVKKPFVNAQANTATLAKGDKLIVTGSAQGDPTSVYVWIFGKNYRTLFQSESVESDGSFEYELDRAATDVMSAGQYFVVVQHPMQNGQPDVIGEPTTVGAGKWINATWVGGSSELNVEVSQLQASESANVLIDLLNKPQSDDTYRKLTFMVEEPWIRIDTVGTKTIGDTVTLSGTTNLAEGDELLIDVTSASFKPTDKTQAEEFSGASGTVTVEKGAEFNTWSFSIGDTSQWRADEYIVKVESIDTDASATTTFNVVEVPPTTAAPPTTAPTTAPPTTVPPTTATPTPPSPGFGALVALIGLGAVAVMVLRRH